MSQEVEGYNAAQLAQKLLTISHVTELVTHWQETHGLAADGEAGPVTIASIAQAIARRAPAAPTAPTAPTAGLSIAEHWLIGPTVTRIPAHGSWYGGTLAAGKPLGIVAHYTDTDAGTAIAMARRRARRFGEDPSDRVASWHVTIETDGSIVIMIPFDRVAWHAGSSTARPVPGLGNANANTIGIELVGFGKSFPAAQVAAASAVWRALVRHYGIAREHAMITHQSIDPTRRDDPGPVWMAQHAPGVLALAYA